MTRTRTRQWADVAQLRRGLYRFFGGALLPPDPDRLEALVAAAGYLDVLGIEAFAFAGPWDALLDTFEDLPSDDKLSAEYIRLFASGMGGDLCPPTESFYRASAEGGGLAAMVAAVQREYRVLGLGPVTGGRAPDHASTQLEAMAELCSREAEHWEASRTDEVSATLESEVAFLGRHLAGWFPAFRARVQRASGLPFYTATVESAHAFLVHEVDFISSLLGTLGDQR